MRVMSATAVPRPAVAAALATGLRRIGSSKRYVLAAYACNILLAAVLAGMLMGALRTSLGASLAGDRMRVGFDSLWYNSFSSQASGIAATFRPSVTGIGAVFDALDSFLDGFDSLLNSGTTTGVLPIAAIYGVLWVFFSGGFLSLFVAPQERRSFALEACRWVPGIAAIAACSLAFYWTVLGVLRPWVTDAISSATRNVIDERIRFAVVLSEYAAIWFVIWIGNMLFDYAKIALVARGRTGGIDAPVRAISAAGLAIWRRPLATSGLYLSLGCVWIAGVLVYWAVVPGAGQSSAPAIFGGFVLGQFFVISRVWTRCLFYASETAMYTAIAKQVATP